MPKVASTVLKKWQIKKTVKEAQTKNLFDIIVILLDSDLLRHKAHLASERAVNSDPQ